MEKITNDAHQHARVCSKYARMAKNISPEANDRGALAIHLAQKSVENAEALAQTAIEIAAQYDAAGDFVKKAELTDAAHECAKKAYHLYTLVSHHVVGNYEARRREQYAIESDPARWGG